MYNNNNNNNTSYYNNTYNNNTYINTMMSQGQSYPSAPIMTFTVNAGGQFEPLYG